MAINPDVFRSILALDAYNRGDNPGITISGDALGYAQVSPTHQVSSLGFSAVAYEWGDTTVIAYRGTDFLWADILSSYAQALGFHGTPQIEAAIAFYKEVLQSPGLGGVELVGHSLGGGLAGLVGSLFGTKKWVHFAISENIRKATFKISSAIVAINKENNSFWREFWKEGGKTVAKIAGIAAVTLLVLILPTKDEDS